MTTAQQGFPNVTQPFVNPQGQINTAWYQLLRALYIRTGSAEGSQTFSAGDIKPNGGSVPQAGWLACDGSAVLRSLYPNLFSAIGTTWGAGDGSSTFNLPDFSGATLIGANGSFPLGSTGGAASAEITIANLPPHNHAVTDPGHVHSALVAASNVTTGNSTGGATAGNTGSAVTGVTTADTGGGTPLPILPPYGAVTWLIKT